MTGAPSSWPGVSRRSTSRLSAHNKTWMAAAKPGHDAVFCDHRCEYNLRLAGDCLAKRGLRRGQPRDRDAIRRAGNVIEPNLMTERDGSGIAAVFAANADLDVRTGLAAAHHADFHELSDAVPIV